MSNSPEVVVVGSINVDLTFAAAARPGPGETLRADRLVRGGGGKGANQAVAAAAAGAVTALVGACGDDEAGREQCAELAAAAVDVSKVAMVDEPTGVAAITVTPDGENSILIAAGANAEVAPEAVVAAVREWRPAVVVGQTEVAAAAVDAAASAAREVGARFVLNPAPVVPLDPATLAAADPLIVNEHEAVDLLALAGRDRPDGPMERARALLDAVGARSVLVTLGARGSVLVRGSEHRHFDATPVTAVDTTGAGDCFVGTLAASLARGETVAAAVQAATIAAAASVQHVGARPRR